MNKFLIAFLIIAGLIGIVFLIKFLTRKNKEDDEDEDIFNRGNRVISKFNDCCKKIKGLIGGGA